MTLIRRTSTVECDWCSKTADLNEDLGYEGDAGYSFNKAVDEAGWSEPYEKDYGYIHLCPECTTNDHYVKDRKAGKKN